MSRTFKPIIMITNLRTARLTCIERARGFMDAASHTVTSPIMDREDSAPYGGLPACSQGGKP
jgi:hypothetical protein